MSSRISHSENFDMLRPLRPSTTVPKFINFFRVMNFLQRFAFLDLSIFCSIFAFPLLDILRINISTTKPVRKGNSWNFSRQFSVVANCKKDSAQLPRCGYRPPKLGKKRKNSEIFTFCSGSCTKMCRASPLLDALSCSRLTPTILLPGEPAHTHPPNFVPQFSKS